MPDLFDQLTLGALEIPNRVVMAPLTRLRAESDGTPTDPPAGWSLVAHLTRQ